MKHGVPLPMERAGPGRRFLLPVWEQDGGRYLRWMPRIGVRCDTMDDGGASRAGRRNSLAFGLPASDSINRRAIFGTDRSQ